MIVQVKYCGGCNPRYDRVEFLQRLMKILPDIEFRTGAADQAAAGLVICGCDAACAETAGCIGRSGRIVVWKENAFDTVCSSLQEIFAESEKKRVKTNDKSGKI